MEYYLDCSKNTSTLLKKKSMRPRVLWEKKASARPAGEGIGVVKSMKEMETQSKLSLKLQAYQYLKTRILNCEYRPNEFLNEQKLCAEMGNISRMNG